MWIALNSTGKCGWAGTCHRTWIRIKVWFGFWVWARAGPVTGPSSVFAFSKADSFWHSIGLTHTRSHTHTSAHPFHVPAPHPTSRGSEWLRKTFSFWLGFQIKPTPRQLPVCLSVGLSAWKFFTHKQAAHATRTPLEQPHEPPHANEYNFFTSTLPLVLFLFACCLVLRTELFMHFFQAFSSAGKKEAKQQKGHRWSGRRRLTSMGTSWKVTNNGACKKSHCQAREWCNDT